MLTDKLIPECIKLKCILDSKVGGQWVNYKLLPYGNNKSNPPEVFYKKGVIRNFVKFTGKHLCQSQFCEISMNTFSYKTPPVAASVIINKGAWFPILLMGN